MKKIFSTVLVLVVGLGLTAGFIMEDPFGSKNTNSADTRQTGNNPVHVSYGTPVYTDNFDGANDTTALRTRGYLIYQNSSPLGSTFWFQGNATVFSAYNGPTTGYVGANFNATSGVGQIDVWMVTPKVTGGGIQAGDSLYFYSRTSTGSTWPDSIRVMYSATDSTVAGSWTELGRFLVSAAGTWEKRGFRAPTASANGRFAIRYTVANGGPSGSNSNYIGIDALSIERSGTPPPTLTYPTTICSYGPLPASPISRWATANAILGDTLYITGGYIDNATTGSTNVQRYNINTNTFSVGTPLPAALAGHSLVQAGNALYLMGGGSTVSTAGTLCYKYTPATGWTSIAPLPGGKAGHGAVNWGDSVIFVLGGPYSTPNTTVYYYRIASNTWGTSSPCLIARRTAAYGIVGNKLFIMAGYNAAFTKNVQIGTIGSNASTVTWAAGPNVPMSKTGSSRPGGVGLGNRFYFITGEVSPAPGTCDSIFIFDADAGSWLPTVLTGRGINGASSNYWEAVDAFVTGSNKGKILIAGGSLTGATNPGLVTIQVDPCTVTNIGNLETPASYSLSQNFPNPFNPVTKISFALPKSGLVTMKVYDILGKEVATLVNEVKNAGNYTVDFNGSSLSSGMYFYKIYVDGFSDVKKMMLLK